MKLVPRSCHSTWECFIFLPSLLITTHKVKRSSIHISIHHHLKPSFYSHKSRHSCIIINHVIRVIQPFTSQLINSSNNQAYSFIHNSTLPITHLSNNPTISRIIPSIHIFNHPSIKMCVYLPSLSHFLHLI